MRPHPTVFSPELDLAPASHRLRRALLCSGVVFAAVCGLVWGSYPLPDATARLNSVRPRGPGFASRELPLTDTERTILGRVDLVHRLYRIGKYDVFMTVIDGTRDRHAVHDPRYCFQGAGWRVLNEQPVSIPNGHASWISAVDGDRRLEVLFWFSDGRTAHTSMARYWRQTTLRRITLGGSGPEPVLVVLQLFGHEQPAWTVFGPRVIERLCL
jgi:hypothetical protein